jgi:hypothetical protein
MARPGRTWARPLAAVLVAMVAAFALAGPGLGQDGGKDKGKTKAKGEADLAGSWSGGGRVQFPSGSVEQARCRAHFSRTSRNSYAVNASCATASGRADQVATVRRVGENRYHGSFHNAEYDITGTISITVNGNSQSVRLLSSSASAFLRLRR